MSFQWIIDRAESFSINRKRQVASTISRSGQVRTVSRGMQPKRIEVTLPDGIAWSEIRPLIEAAESLDRVTAALITIPYAKFPWYYSNNPLALEESYSVRCIQFPEWTIFARDQVRWSGPFVFIQAL